MTHDTHTNRRTVLKTIGASIAGASVLAGTASAAGYRPGSGNAVPGANARRPVVEIVATHEHDHGGNGGEHQFALSAHEVPAGWTTLTLDNRTEHVHFAYLSKVPQVAIDEAAAANRDLLDYYFEQVTEPFQGFMDALAGKTPRYPIVFPSWFGDVVPSGGVGLTAAYSKAAATVDLAAGKYVMECYVKDASNTFHGLEGMVELLTVTGEASGASAPRATADLSIGSGGFDFPDSVRPGRHAVAVHFDTQQVYSNLVGHDAHLIRLDGDTTVDDVNGWMNWMDPTGLVADGSEPTSFLGGVETVFPAGTTEYAHVTLTPGEYAWVAEVPDPASKGLLKTFTVPAE